MVETLFQGRKEVAPGAGTLLRSLDEIDMERRSHELLGNLAVQYIVTGGVLQAAVIVDAAGPAGGTSPPRTPTARRLRELRWGPNRT